MARIRTIKPEAFESESLAECSVTAERTFFGLLTQADDEGRHRDHPAIIAGRLWALRPEHTAAHVARDLDELAAAGLICRYDGCDGRTWLHVVTWQQHQKINKPTDSRLPKCPLHHGPQLCGKCQSKNCGAAAPAAPAPVFREDSGSTPGVLQLPVSTDSDREAAPAGIPAGTGEPLNADLASDSADNTGTADKTAGQRLVLVRSGNIPGGLREDSGPGSRILDPGSVPTGRETPAPAPASETVSAKDLVAEYASGCRQRPPSDLLGLLGRKTKMLLDEGFDAGVIRVAMVKLREKGLHPSVLPSLVNEVVNASPPSSASGAGPWATSARPAYTPYMNPTAPTGTFGGRL